jgi:hypothetical protein
MQETIEAIYKDGVLRPLKPLAGVQENQTVILTLNSLPSGNPLAEWVGGLSAEDAQRMVQVIEAEFETVDPDEWR